MASNSNNIIFDSKPTILPTATRPHTPQPPPGAFDWADPVFLSRNIYYVRVHTTAATRNTAAEQHAVNPQSADTRALPTVRQPRRAAANPIQPPNHRSTDRYRAVSKGIIMIVFRRDEFIIINVFRHVKKVLPLSSVA